MDSPQLDTSIVLTDAAAERVRRFLAKTGGAVGMRLGVKKTGCSGMAYVVDLAEDVSEKDSVFESNGVKVVVDDKSLPFVKGTRIDFTSDGLNESFYYDNPNVKSLCGCGESFGV
ncbi:MAG: iron-sulfur cluster assembly accessory protein [Gammaproteobacteria bacterium]|nr:iron-sulfur cluster assembly accessory protein [Gammaproteobacteria bacterium]